MRQGLRYKTKKTCLIFVVLFALFIPPPSLRAETAGRSLSEKIKPRTTDLLRLPLAACANAARSLYNLAQPRNRYEQEIQRLNERIAALTSEAVSTKETAHENQRLRQLLEFKGRMPQKSVAAEVIARNPFGWGSFVIIDKGKRSGVDVKNYAIKDDGLVGRVVEAGENTAKVMLIDSPSFRLGVAVQRTREQGVLAGLGAGMCKMIYLPYDTQAAPGDIVVTGETSVVPVKGMMIGRITKVAKVPGSLYASAVVKPSSNLFRVEELLCVAD